MSLRALESYAAWLKRDLNCAAAGEPCNQQQPKPEHGVGLRLGHRDLIDADGDSIRAVVVVIGARRAIETEAIRDAEKQTSRAHRCDELLERTPGGETITNVENLAQ